MKKSVKSFACLWSPWHCECSYEKLGVNGLREPVELAKSAPTASHYKAKFPLFPHLLSGNLSTFLKLPWYIHPWSVIYRHFRLLEKDKVRSGHLRACPSWFIAKFGELQHQRIFPTDAHQNDPNVLFFSWKYVIFGYTTLHGLIYQETLKKN